MTFTSELVHTTQTRLAALEYYTGALDGVAGPATENAMSRFKGQHSLLERAWPGPITLSKLWSSSAKKAPAAVPVGNEPAWLSEARNLLGVRETPGARNNPLIMTWARDLDQWYLGDDVPWCGLFVAHCMRRGAPNEPQAFNRLGARNWYTAYGEPCGAELGAVCSLWRTHKTKSWNGHVFIVTGISDTAVRGIGGNQSDQVSELWFEKDRVLGYCKPVGAKLVPAPTAVRGALSTNEA